MALLGWVLAAGGQESAGSITDLQRKIALHISQPHFRGSSWGIKIVSLDTGVTLFETNDSQYFSPASNSKLFTTACALGRLGSQYRIQTSLYSEHPPDRSGVLTGNLVIFGRGDPSFAAAAGASAEEAVQRIVTAIKSAGVKRIRGDIVADESFFRGPPFGSGWAVDDLQYSYGAEISSLTVNANLVSLQAQPGRQAGAPCLITVQPAAAGISIRNQTVTVNRGEKSTLNIQRLPAQNILVATGSMAIGEATREEEIPIHNPAGYFGRLCQKAFALHGIRVSGSVRTANWLNRPDARRETFELAVVDSIPLGEMIRQIQKPSQNLYTDLLLCHLGALRSLTNLVAARETSEDAGLQELSDFLDRAGVSAEEVLFEEGSGLSRNNLVTPNAIVHLLRFMNNHPEAAVYRAALPIAGVDGTLRRRMTNTVAQGNVRAKTGSLRWANSLSGYATTQAGELLAFSILLNRYRSPDAKRPATSSFTADVRRTLATDRSRTFGSSLADKSTDNDYWLANVSLRKSFGGP